MLRERAAGAFPIPILAAFRSPEERIRSLLAGVRGPCPFGRRSGRAFALAGRVNRIRRPEQPGWLAGRRGNSPAGRLASCRLAGLLGSQNPRPVTTADGPFVRKHAGRKHAGRPFDLVGHGSAEWGIYGKLFLFPLAGSERGPVAGHVSRPSHAAGHVRPHGRRRGGVYPFRPNANPETCPPSSPRPACRRNPMGAGSRATFRGAGSHVPRKPPVEPGAPCRPATGSGRGLPHFGARRPAGRGSGALRPGLVGRRYPDSAQQRHANRPRKTGPKPVATPAGKSPGPSGLDLTSGGQPAQIGAARPLGLEQTQSAV